METDFIVELRLLKKTNGKFTKREFKDQTYEDIVDSCEEIESTIYHFKHIQDSLGAYIDSHRSCERLESK